MNKVLINRAPVLTLWAAIVAKRLGFDEAEALTLGRAVAGLNAQSKGRRLGIFQPHQEAPTRVRDKPVEEMFRVELLGRAVSVRNMPDGIRAVQKGRTADPDAVRHYLEDKFGDDLKKVRSALEKLAKAYKRQELAEKAYSLYEQFRPEIPAGTKGWGAKGDLDLSLIGRLSKEAKNPKR